MFRDINFVISVNSVVPMMHTKKFLAPVNVFCGVLVTKYDFNIRDKKQMYESHNGMSMIVVTPPAAAAWVAVTYPSQEVRPGSFTCTCESTTPAISALSPPSII